MTQVNSQTIKYSLAKDIGLLVKVKLSLTVLISSVLAFVIFSSESFNLTSFILVIVGGALVTFAANAMNQVLEREFDKLMERTHIRPLPQGRMNVSFAVLLSGVFCTLGVIALTLVNAAAGLLAMISFLIYAFVYTPLKRYSTVAIPVGAIPGALPILIGSVAAQGYISPEAFALFGIQYLWQFPHFWAIAWMGHDDYSKAGFKLIRDIDGRPDPMFGIYSAIYASLTVFFILLYAYVSSIAISIVVVLILLIGIYAFLGYKLYLKNDRASARTLFLYSLAYLPLVLLLFTVNKYFL
jgi:protoheme IX farnesyltransferase